MNSNAQPQLIDPQNRFQQQTLVDIHLKRTVHFYEAHTGGLSLDPVIALIRPRTGRVAIALNRGRQN